MILVCALLLAGPVLRVTETAGIRRFGYPVTAKIGVAGGRLTEHGKPVPAQFQNGEVDFNVSLGPYEQREYRVEEGPPEAAPQTVLEESEDFVVSYGAALRWRVPRSLLGFLRSVKTPGWDYLRTDSAGLLIRNSNDTVYRAGGLGNWGEAAKARVVKQGPLATTLEFTATEPVRGRFGVSSQVRMEFPRSKSWVKTTWTIEDPEGYVAALGADLNLNLASPPVLVDFGGGSMVYARLRPGQSAALIGEAQSWRVELAGAPYAAGRDAPAEGWAHVMDKDRCTAVAVEQFGRRREDRIEASAEGRLQIWRSVPGRGVKTFTFWLHFVGMPVHVGAATSPQSMLAPLKVEVH